jgi:hypothetical protein
MEVKLTEQQIQDFLLRSVEKNISEVARMSMSFEVELQIKAALKREVKRQLDSFVPDKEQIKGLIEEGVKEEIARYAGLLINKASRGLK